jgi:hypothetical protein
MVRLAILVPRSPFLSVPLAGAFVVLRSTRSIQIKEWTGGYWDARLRTLAVPCFMSRPPHIQTGTILHLLFTVITEMEG